MSNKLKYYPKDWEALLDFVAGVVWLIEADTNSTHAWELKKISAMVSSVAKAVAKDELTANLANELGDWVATSFTDTGKVALFKSNRFIQKQVKACMIILNKEATAKQISNFKSFLYRLAFNIANATGHGQIGFGEKVDVEEAEVLICLKSELNIA